MDSFPIQKNEQSMFVTQFLCRSIEEQIKNWCTFPPVYVNKLFSHRQGSRVQVQYGGLQGTNKQKLESVQITTKNKSAEQIIPKCWCALVQAWHSDRFKGQHWFPRWPFCGVLPLPFTCYCLSTPRRHWSENKSFSKKCLCGFPSVDLSVLTLHKQLLYWLWTRPGGSGKHYWRVPGTSRQSQFHLPQPQSQSSGYCSSLPSSAERVHYSSGGF